MDTRTLIWVDLRVKALAAQLWTTISTLCHVRRIQDPSAISEAIRTLSPFAVCFEFDYPGSEQLEPLQRTRLEFPNLPVLMITIGHSEALAVGALRMRVWDYLVMPVEISHLCSRVSQLAGSSKGSSSSNAILGHSAPTVAALTAKRDKDPSTKELLLPALTFVEANFSDKVTLGVVAGLCGLGRYQFSRAFKQAHGTTFREFLIVYRINKAMQLLGIDGASITDVAFSVGFNDLSHFAQMFRRYVGVCPSDYLHRVKITCSQGPHSWPTYRVLDRGVQNARNHLQQNPSSA